MRSILSHAYADRRVVLIAPRDKHEAHQSNVDWEDVASNVLALNTFGPALMLTRWLVTKASRGRINLGRDRSPKPGGFFRRQRTNIPGTLPVPLEHAIQELQFPPGHPLLDHAYVGHPLEAARYLPFASFHRLLFEQKVNELVTLLASLGAEHLRVHFNEGYDRAAGVNFGVNIPGKPSVEAKGGASQSVDRHAIFEETYSPHGDPVIPSGLVWYEHEPSWLALARRRMQFKTKTFNVELVYSEDYGISAELHVGLEKLGIKFGGNYQRFETTRWDFEGTFAA